VRYRQRRTGTFTGTRASLEARASGRGRAGGQLSSTGSCVRGCWR
jgi:hypothetical protein